MASLPTAIAGVSADIALQRESMRKWLALIVIGLVAVLAILIVVYLWIDGNGDNTQLLATAIFAPIIGIAGTVLGFYFGSQDPPNAP